MSNISNSTRFASREAAGLVSIKTSRTPFNTALDLDPPPFVQQPYRRSVLVERTSCQTGIPRRHEILIPGVIPEGIYPTQPDAMEIDQDLMRLRRLKKNVITSARYHQHEVKGLRKMKQVMVTLTYRDDVEWSAKHISTYLDSVKKWLLRKGHGFRYVWVFELTKRGRPHYHVLVWMPRGLCMPKADKRGWWSHGMTKTEWARNAVGYIAKYASKGNGEQVIPKGVRLYGVGGLNARSRMFRAWWNLPTGVRRWGLPADQWRRAFGGGWVCRRTGECRPSLWSVVIVAGRVFAFPRPQPKPSPLDELLLALSLCGMSKVF